jgi:phage tail tape-measure protein
MSNDDQSVGGFHYIAEPASHNGPFESYLSIAGNAVGGYAGGQAGEFLGAIIGTFVGGPAGTVIGSAVGTIVGGYVGSVTYQTTGAAAGFYIDNPSTITNNIENILGQLADPSALMDPMSQR